MLSVVFCGCRIVLLTHRNVQRTAIPGVSPTFHHRHPAADSAPRPLSAPRARWTLPLPPLSARASRVRTAPLVSMLRSGDPHPLRQYEPSTSDSSHTPRATRLGLSPRACTLNAGERGRPGLSGHVVGDAQLHP